MCVVCVLCVHVIMLRMTLKEFLLDSKESRRVLSKQASKSASMQASKSASMQASMQVSRQASKQTGKQACNVQEGKQAGKQASRKASKQASKQAGKQASRQASKQESKHASQQACQQAGKQAEKQAGKQAVKHKSTWKAFSRSHALEGLVIIAVIKIRAIIVHLYKRVELLEDQPQLLNLFLKIPGLSPLLLIGSCKHWLLFQSRPDPVEEGHHQLRLLVHHIGR